MEAAANEEGAVDAAAAKEETDATEEVEVSRRPWLSKMTRSRGGCGGEWAREGAVGAAAVKEEAEATEEMKAGRCPRPLKIRRGHGRGGRWYCGWLKGQGEAGRGERKSRVMGKEPGMLLPPPKGKPRGPKKQRPAVVCGCQK